MINNLFNPFIVLKIGFLIVDLFYIVFLFILLNRILSMNKVVKEVHDEMIIRSIAIFKILLAISLFLLALAVL